MNSDSYRRYYSKLMLAQHMRDNPTPAEAALWSRLRKNQIGYPFQRQRVILGYIVDFLQPKSKTVVEVDGGIHKQTKEWDDARTYVLERAGYSVLRYSNEDVLHNIGDVVEGIVDWIEVGDN